SGLLEGMHRLVSFANEPRWLGSSSFRRWFVDPRHGCRRNTPGSVYVADRPGFQAEDGARFPGSAPLEPRPQLGPVALDRLLFRLGVPSAHVVPVLGRGENVSVVRARDPDGLAQGSHAPAGDLEARHANP